MTHPPLTLPQRAALAKVACGVEATAGVALLCGPSGVGKTHVLEQLAAEGRLVGRCGGVRDVAGWLAVEDDLPRLVLADDAHLAAADDLVRLVARCRAERPAAALVLAGQGRLLTLVARERRLEQAIRIRATLLPGSLADTEQLLAGGDQADWPSFDEEATVTIHEIAAGIPADVVRLADLAGVVAAARADGCLTTADIEAIHRRLTPHAA